jgi:hypothetical protein
MKTASNYVPQYSLSLYYLKKIITKRELDALLKKYVAAKQANWKHNIKGK